MKKDIYTYKPIGPYLVHPGIVKNIITTRNYSKHQLLLKITLMQ